MATVGTSTQTDILSYPGLPSIARDMSTGSLGDYMYVILRTDANTLGLYRSTNSGTSWSLMATFSHTGLQEWSRFVVDKGGYGHIAYRVNASSTDTLWYRRITLATVSWSNALQVSGSDANGGVAGSRWQGVDLAVVRHADGAYAIAVFGAFTDGTSRYGLYAQGVSIARFGAIYNNDGLIAGNRMWLQSGTAPGRSGVSVEIEHNGDGITSSTPHLWVSFGRTALRMVKLAWNGSASGSWTGPTNWQTIRSTIPAHDHHPARWDGKQWLMGVISPDDATVVRIYQRNQANTATTTYDTPVHPTGNIRNIALSYDNTTKDIRVFAVGTSTGVLYYCDYIRATSTWSAWTTAVATAIGPGVAEFGVRAGGSADNSRIDILTTASGSPNTVSHTAMTTTSVPNIATWAANPTVFNGGARDVAASLVLDWDFVDLDPGQTQGSFAVSRQIGAGTVQYWRASDSTWQASEVQNATSTSSLTLPSGWGLNADSPHTYKVKVWDSTNVAAAGYSDPYVVIPSALVNPTITSPTAAQVLNVDRVSVVWTVAEQTAYRVRLDTNPVTTTVYDSGWVSDPTFGVTSALIPVALGNGTAWQITLQTANNEGLASTAVTRQFSVQYSAPPASISTFVASDTDGTITVTSSALTPVGTQPAITNMDLYRRVALYTVLNSNPTITGSTSGYITGGGAGATLSYSTAQSAPGSSPGAARLVPNGVGASPSVESNNVIINTEQPVIASAWVRPDTANKPIFISVNWYTTGFAYISSTTIQVTTPVAGAWHYLEVVGIPSSVANVGRASVAAGVNSTPAVGDAIYADEMRLRQHDPSEGVRVAQSVTSPAVVTDWTPASGKLYEYRWVALGANGTVINGPWMS